MSVPKSGKRRGDALERARNVFLHGFAFTRSFTHPYEVATMGGMSVLRDTPRKNPADYRREEWIALRVPAEEADAAARSGTRGSFCICALTESEQTALPLRAAYRALGYRLGMAEPLMVHRLAKIPPAASPADIVAVTSNELADQLAKAAGARQVLPQHLPATSRLRAYAARIDDRIVGWVRSVRCDQGHWCSNLYVLPPFRRRGIARALLVRMLRGDREQGATQAVLTASRAGTPLYASLGYRQVGTFLLFTPRKT